MSDAETIPRINRLSAALAGQIAAGEVIERPASVIKELVENSIDAGAGRIDIDISRGGLQRIRVRDDGHGIHPEDMLLALESHATSKLAGAADLAAIASLGFRGEALASIAAVCEFELSSRIASMDSGWRLRTRAGTGAAPEPAAHAVGTTVTVENLFQPVPARRRFLRSERTEFLHILGMVRRLALSGPSLELQLRHNGRVVLHCRGEPDYPARLRTVLGENFVQRARNVDSRAGGMHLWGWLGGRELSRSQSDRQYFYVNGRMVRDKRLNHAVRQAVDAEVGPGRFPSYVLHLEIDPAVTDVNVHPAKQEVRFEHARDVHDFIVAALREVLHAAPVPAAHRPGPPAAPRREAPLQELAALYRPQAPPGMADAGAGLQPLAALHGRFILARRGERVLLIDARNAVRLSLLQRLRQQPAARPLLVPVLLACSSADLDALQAHRELLAGLGLELEAAGPASLRLRAIPAPLRDADGQALVRAVLARLQQPGTADVEAVIEVLAEQGGAAALPVTTLQDMERMLAALDSCGFDPDQDRRTGLWRELDASALSRWLGS